MGKPSSPRPFPLGLSCGGPIGPWRIAWKSSNGRGPAKNSSMGSLRALKGWKEDVSQLLLGAEN